MTPAMKSLRSICDLSLRMTPSSVDSVYLPSPATISEEMVSAGDRPPDPGSGSGGRSKTEAGTWNILGGSCQKEATEHKGR